MKTFAQQRIARLEEALLRERNALEAVREERDAARAALKNANDLIYAAGAPLGSDNYFKLRGILVGDAKVAKGERAQEGKELEPLCQAHSHGKTWTPEEDALLLQLFNNRLSGVPQMAIELRRSRGAIVSRLFQQGKLILSGGNVYRVDRPWLMKGDW